VLYLFRCLLPLHLIPNPSNTSDLLSSSLYMLTLRGPCYADPWATMICYILIPFCCIRSAIHCTNMQFFDVLVVLQGRPWYQWLEILEWLSIDRGKVPVALFGFKVHSYLILLLDCSFSSSLFLHWTRWISRWVTAFLFDFLIRILCLGWQFPDWCSCNTKVNLEAFQCLILYLLRCNSANFYWRFL
jgi:hypothetical protein